MAKSEIDDIFASKGKVKIAQTSTSSSALSPLPEKSKKDKKRKRKVESTSTSEKPSQRKASVAETIVDPSANIPSAKRLKTARSSGESKSKPVKSDAKKEDEDKFKDSRGSGPRRKTEEGWSIYKADELGIGDEGEDTPLCPFDCDCCF